MAQSQFCWAHGQLLPVRNDLCLDRLKASEDTFISGLKGWFLRSKQTLSTTVFNSHPKSYQESTKKPGKNVPGSQEPLTKSKRQRQFWRVWMDWEGFQVLDQGTWRNKYLSGSNLWPPHRTVMESVQRPLSLRQAHESSQLPWCSHLLYADLGFLNVWTTQRAS